LALVLFILTGCAGLGKRLEPPRIALANIKIQEAKVLETVFEIEIRVFNTNEIPLEIKGIECDLEINGKQFATGVSSMEVTIPSYETALIPMTVFSSVLDIVIGLTTLSDTDSLKYDISGRIRLGKGVTPALLPFKAHGELPLGGLSVPNDT
jgi:LEA14-like dessication related protein